MPELNIKVYQLKKEPGLRGKQETRFYADGPHMREDAQNLAMLAGNVARIVYGSQKVGKPITIVPVYDKIPGSNGVDYVPLTDGQQDAFSTAVQEEFGKLNQPKASPRFADTHRIPAAKDPRNREDLRPQPWQRF